MLYKQKTSIDLSEKRDEDILFLSLSNPDAFAELVKRYQEPFINKAASILGCREKAKDVVQDTFVKIYLASAKFKEMPDASFKSWAYKILVNTCFSCYKKEKGKQSLSFDENILLSEAVMVDDFDKNITLDFVSSLIARLPGVLHRSSKMYFLEDLSYEEIAQIENTSVTTIRTRVHRAKKELNRLNSILVY